LDVLRKGREKKELCNLAERPGGFERKEKAIVKRKNARWQGKTPIRKMPGKKFASSGHPDKAQKSTTYSLMAGRSATRKAEIVWVVEGKGSKETGLGWEKKIQTSLPAQWAELTKDTRDGHGQKRVLHKGNGGEK